MSDHLEALEKRGDEVERFHDCQRQANKYIRDTGSQALVNELRVAREGRRQMRVGTINTLVLLHHIDRLEAELANEPLRMP
jgi:hypothetical protein